MQFHLAAVSWSSITQHSIWSAPERTLSNTNLRCNSSWVDAGTHRAAHYNNVRPGNYRFRVKACNKDGVWSERGADIRDGYLPHYSANVVVFGFGGSRLCWRSCRHSAVFDTAKIKGQLALAEQRHAIERERGRIAKDIHDDLGASLTRIMMLGHSAEEGLTRREDVSAPVQKMVHYARNTVQSLDEIVWAINPQNDTLDGLVAYIGHYADQFLKTPIFIADWKFRLSCPRYRCRRKRATTFFWW